MPDLVVVCGGREVDDHGRPQGERCGQRFRPPPRLGAPPERLAEVDRHVTWPPGVQTYATLYDLRQVTVAEAVEMAWAAGWALPDGQDPADGQLVGTCPRCRRPPPEVVELVREVKPRAT